MILLVDMQNDPADIWVLEEDRPAVTVKVCGGRRLAEVDHVLWSAGVGRAVGHHVEVAVDWLVGRWSSRPTSPSSPAERDVCHWIVRERLDGSGMWVAAPIEWDDPGHVAHVPSTPSAMAPELGLLRNETV